MAAHKRSFQWISGHRSRDLCAVPRPGRPRAALQIVRGRQKAAELRFLGAHSPSASDSGEPLATLRRVMTPSTPWGNERGQLPQRLRLGSQIVGRRQARRLSRRFARVGITTPPDRLRQMLAGAPAAYAEVADFKFALIATQFKRDQFRARVRRMKRRGARTLIFVGMVLVTLNFLFCMAWALFNLTLEAPPL
jgi:hypothetical protein